MGDPATVDVGSLRVGVVESDGVFEPCATARRAVKESAAQLSAAGAQVGFGPASEGTTTGAFGTTNDSGHCSVRAFDEKDGAIPGEYKIQVSKTKEVKLPGKLDGGDAVRFDYAVPPKYTGAKTSGLSVTVPEAGKKDIDLKLTSK